MRDRPVDALDLRCRPELRRVGRWIDSDLAGAPELRSWARSVPVDGPWLGRIDKVQLVERGRERGCGAPSVDGSFLEGPQQDVAELAVGHDGEQRPRRIVSDPVHQACDAADRSRGAERRLTVEEREQCGSERPDVGRRPGLTEGSEPLGRSMWRSQRLHRVGCDELLDPCHVEIGECHLAVLGHQEVRRLHIAMNDSLVVRPLQCGGTDHADLTHPTRGERARPGQLIGERLLHQPHDDASPAVVRERRRVHIDDSRQLADRTQRRTLTTEPSPCRFVVHRGLQHLHRHQSVEADLAGGVHRRGTAAAHLDEFVISVELDRRIGARTQAEPLVVAGCQETLVASPYRRSNL